MEPPTLQSTKTWNSLGDKVKGELTEVKMSRIRKISELDQSKKTYQSDEKSHRVGSGVFKNDQASEFVSSGRRGQSDESGGIQRS